MTPYVLVLDQGGQSSRAIVFDASGVVVAQARVPVTTNYPAQSFVEQSPQEILQSLYQVIADVAEQLGEQCSNITQAALIVQRSSLVAVDVISRKTLSSVLSWQDTRNAEWLSQKIKTASQWLRKNTGLYANAHYGASKIRWLLDSNEAVKESERNNTLCITPLAGFLCWQLTQAETVMVDAVIASRTLLTKMGESQWSPELLDFFAISSNVLPKIYPSLYPYGVISVGKHTVPLTLLGGDQSFFMLSHALQFDESTIFINAGTGAFIQQKMAALDVPRNLLVSPLCIATEKNQSIVVAEGTVNAAATALEWLWQQQGAVFSSNDWQAADKESNLFAEKTPIFINRITATGSPDWLPAGDSYFSEESSFALQAIAVLESIVFALQRNIDRLRTVKPYSAIVLSGGLSNLPIFCQRIADISGVRVYRSNDVEACARGAAAQLLPSVIGKQYYDQFEPQPVSALQKRYQQWTALMSQLSISG